MCIRDRWYDINILGSLSCKGTTEAPRFGNPTPRIAETPGGMLNAVGLQNPGVEAVVAHELPELAKIFRKPVLANVGGFSLEEYARNLSLIHIWNNRYRYVDELKRMGAHIQVDDKTAVVEGVEKLTGARVQASDLRAGAALVIAALAAQGESEIGCVQYIERGYEDIVGKLRALGADIRSVEVSSDEDGLETRIS